MKKFTRLLLSALTALAIVPVAQAASQNNASIKTISAQQPQFTVQLPANATTGYQWYLAHYDHHLLKLLSYHYQPGNSKLMGAPGTAIFVFKAKSDLFTAPQKTALSFVYQRAWETTTGQTNTVWVVSITDSNADQPTQAQLVANN